MGVQVSGTRCWSSPSSPANRASRSRLTAPLLTSALCSPRSMATGPISGQCKRRLRQGVVSRSAWDCDVAFVALRHSDGALLRRSGLRFPPPRKPVTGNHTLCHGDLGNADILLTASEVLQEADGGWTLTALPGPRMATARESGWICGNPLGVESPGLMTGISGIGYALLRLADPSRVPSILALEPARCCEDVLP